MAETPKRGRKIAGIVVRLAVAGGLIAWVVGSGRLKGEDLRHALDSPGWLAAAAGTYALATFVGMARWWVLLAAQGIRLRVKDVFQLTFIGFLFNSYIPGSVSGDVIKAYYISCETHNRAGAVMSVMIDRVLGLFVFVSMAAVSLSIWMLRGGLADMDVANRPTIRRLATAVIVVNLLMLAGFCVLWSRALRRNATFNRLLAKLPFSRTIRNVYDAIHVYRDKPGYVLAAVVLALFVAAPIILSQYCCGIALGEKSLSLGSYFFLGAIGVVINAVPLGPMGIGSGQVGYDVLFKAFGSSKGAAVITVLQVIIFVWNQLGWVFYLRGRDKYRAAFEQEPEATAGETE